MTLQETAYLLHLLWLLPLVGAIIIFGTIRRRRLLTLNVPDRDQRSKTTASVSLKKRIITYICRAGALLFALIALARPQLGEDELGFESAGGDVCIVMDISRSMFARDAKPDRLTVAKNTIREVVAALPSHRFGLTVFAGKAYSACPLTTSRTSFHMILNDVSPLTMPYGGTNLQEALKESLRLENAAETSNQTIIIFSDGDILQGESDELIPVYRNKGIRVLTVGVGTANSNALIQLPDTTFIRYNDHPVRTSLNDKPLKELANQTGGTYWHAGSEPILAEKIATAVMDRPQQSRPPGEITLPVERYQWPLAIALLCLAGSLTINDKRHLAAASAILLVSITHPLYSAAQERSNEIINAEEAYKAEQRPRQKMIKRYQLAVLLHSHKLNDEARLHYKQLILSNAATSPLRASAMQNLAVLNITDGQATLSKEPKDSIASFNKVIRLCTARLELAYSTNTAKTLELARTLLIEAETRFRQQEELKRLQAKAITDIQQAATAQEKSNQDQTGSPEPHESARKKTKEAESSASKLKDAALNSMMATACNKQNAMVKPQYAPQREQLGRDALDSLNKALEYLGARKKRNDPTKQNAAAPPKQLPKNQEFNEIANKKKRAIMVLRAMRKEEEDGRKEIRKTREHAYRARIGEEKDW